MSHNQRVESLVAALESYGVKTEHEVNASNLNTYRLGGFLKNLILINDMNDIEVLSKQIPVNPLEPEDIFILGNGSNIIVNDDGFEGIVFKFGNELAEVIRQDEKSIEVGAGMLLPKFARKAVASNFFGCEFYVGIPGTIGGAVVMNAGGHGKQTSDVLKSAKVLSLSTGIIDVVENSDCDFSYRHSKFTSIDLVLSAEYSCTPGDVIASKEELDSIVKWRRENQPGGRNIGSVFQNTERATAGSLIEKCGLKGYKIGGAFVSEKHANFIQAEEGAKASDVVDLIEYVRSVVNAETGISLKNEVRYIGFNQNG